jgi:anion-transporting  ArsA/GET3 family ATPase
MERAGRRFLIVAGKGGVGKTTVCAAEAIALAARGKRVLIAMCNAKERLSTMLGSAPVGSDVSLVAKNIWAVNMDPEKALEEYGRITLKVRALNSAVFGNRYTRAFFRAVPGMHDWSMLGKAWWHTTEKNADGTPRFDVVILDAPATGHGLDMLRVPKVIVDIVPPGLLRRDAERAWVMFQDPAQSGVVLVTLPEEMPVTETIELAAALMDELRFPIDRVVVNGVLPELFSKEERVSLAALHAVGEGPGEAALLAGRDRALRESAEAQSLPRLASELRGVAQVCLPLLLEDAATPSAIRDLARRLAPKSMKEAGTEGKPAAKAAL